MIQHVPQRHLINFLPKKGAEDTRQTIAAYKKVESHPISAWSVVNSNDLKKAAKRLSSPYCIRDPNT
jgi:hypothetical protein